MGETGNYYTEVLGHKSMLLHCCIAAVWPSRPQWPQWPQWDLVGAQGGLKLL